MTTPVEIRGRIYSDNEITGQVLRIMDDAKIQVAIVSPYVDRVPHVEQALLRAKNNGVTISAYVRSDGDELGGRNGKDALAWFKANDIEVFGIPNLHAKFYMNEQEAVVTSMNLLKSSWSGSLELGFVVEGDAHDQLVKYLTNTLRVLANAVPVRSSSERSPARSTSTSRSKSKIKTSTSTKEPEAGPKGLLGSFIGAVKNAFDLHPGYCIRCGEPLSEKDVEAGKTLCAKDYRAWARYKDPNFREKYCANCGSKRKTSYAQPYCQECQD